MKLNLVRVPLEVTATTPQYDHSDGFGPFWQCHLNSTYDSWVYDDLQLEKTTLADKILLVILGHAGV